MVTVQPHQSLHCLHIKNQLSMHICGKSLSLHNWLAHKLILGLVAHPVASLTADPGVEILSLACSNTFVEIDREKILQSFFSFR